MLRAQPLRLVPAGSVTPWLSPDSLPKALGLLETPRSGAKEERGGRERKGEKAIIYFYMVLYVPKTQQRWLL